MIERRNNFRKDIAFWGSLIAIVSILCSVGATFGVEQYRLTNDEGRIGKLETGTATDHEWLVEVRRDFKWIVKKLGGPE